MNQPTQQLATHYHLRLSRVWREWLDTEVHDIVLPASFRTKLDAQRLTEATPAEIWPGFMLPDTLPLVGNAYGDWICVRVTDNHEFGELIHWYHGGGDWIPLGNRLAEAILHDAVDQFRPLRRQMLRGAAETLEPEQRSHVLAALAAPQLAEWLAEHLTPAAERPEAVSQAVSGIVDALADGDYPAALSHLWTNGWAPDAVACDLIEEFLQRGPAEFANPAIAQRLGVSWSPDYVRWLFDLAAVPDALRARISSEAGIEQQHWPVQAWKQAGEIADQVLARRSDLGWAFNIAGWCRQRVDDGASASRIYFDGRMASAFSDQSVRMRTHWCDSRFGKFSIAQLRELSSHLSEAERGDRYLQTIAEAPENLRLALVQEFWMNEGRRLMASDAPDRAYDCFYRAGWDLGVQRLADYQPIFERLIASAKAAGWDARAAVAETHLACLRRRQR